MGVIGMRMVDIIEKKRDGHELTKEEIAFVINGLHRWYDSGLSNVRIPNGCLFPRDDSGRNSRIYHGDG